MAWAKSPASLSISIVSVVVVYGEVLANYMRVKSSFPQVHAGRRPYFEGYKHDSFDCVGILGILADLDLSSRRAGVWTDCVDVP